ncbi:MAG: dimethylsulfonioproprionate lyase family protein [Cypionkella sp.]
MTGLLAPVLAPLRQHPDALATLAGALADLGPELEWTTRRSAGPSASAGFATAHANAMLVGPSGLERREDVWIGLSLMAPHTRYPDHNHPPEEVYLVLSDGDFLQGDADWLPRKPGQTVYNPPGIRHAMRAGAAPFLALWCLPI